MAEVVEQHRALGVLQLREPASATAGRRRPRRRCRTRTTRGRAAARRRESPETAALHRGFTARLALGRDVRRDRRRSSAAAEQGHPQARREPIPTARAAAQARRRGTLRGGESLALARHAERHRRGRRGRCRLADGWPHNAVDSLPRGRSRRSCVEARERRAAAASEARIDPTAPDIHLGHAVVLRKLASSRTPATAWC